MSPHNPLHKLYTYSIQPHIPLTHNLLIFTHPISSQILIKPPKIDLQIILSTSPPTSLPIQLPKHLYITPIHFIPQNHFNSHPQTIIN
ncbi:formate dehydrogenase accessory sulfurtransferase FdhD [Staphylococcus epidermidis]|uniref:formate dehydrogenase accessory sulfurtransferase FdhD n=1 Tax=Staphylococcus epidermidis TaxID=1282 RepID=UPI0037DA577B